MPAMYDRMPGAVDRSITPVGRKLMPKIYIYDRVIDLLLANPEFSLSAIAKQLGRSPAWISSIVHTDAFRDQYELRRAEKNARVADEINAALSRVALKSLDVLEKKIDENPKAVSPQLALEIADKSLERLGYGVKLPGAPAVQITQQSISISTEDFKIAQGIVRQVESTAPAVHEEEKTISVRAEPGAVLRESEKPNVIATPNKFHPSQAPLPRQGKGTGEKDLFSLMDVEDAEVLGEEV